MQFRNHDRRVAIALDFLLIVLSAVLLSLSFPAFSYAAFAWLALVPLILQIYRSGYAKAIFSAFICGVFFYVCLMGWTIRIETMNLPRFCVFGLYLAAYFGLFAALAKYFHERFPQWDSLTFPALWTALEFLKCNFGFLSFPPGVLGYSQYQVLPVAGIAGYTGVYGVSFAIVAVNAALASIAWNYRLSPVRARVIPRSSLLLLGCVFFLLCAFILNSSAGNQARTGRTIDIAVVQGNAVGDEKPGYEKYLREVYPIYEKLTLEAVASGASIIVWPSSTGKWRV